MTPYFSHYLEVPYKFRYLLNLYASSFFLRHKAARAATTQVHKIQPTLLELIKYWANFWFTFPMTAYFAYDLVVSLLNLYTSSFVSFCSKGHTTKAAPSQDSQMVTFKRYFTKRTLQNPVLS